MGEAKRRGSYEQRKALAIERDAKIAEARRKDKQLLVIEPNRAHDKSETAIIYGLANMALGALIVLNRRR